MELTKKYGNGSLAWAEEKVQYEGVMDLRLRFRVNEPVERYLELEGRGVPILNVQQEMKGIAIVARDVTERNHTERLLMQTEN